MPRRLPLVLIGLAALTPVAAVAALQQQADRPPGLTTPTRAAVHPAFDIVHTRISVRRDLAVFRMRVSGRAGARRPTRTGKLAGSRVFSYVWPTTLDPGVVGFEAGSGILAFAVTSHPDFDDTPLFDENGDGRLGNDGDLWHSHWVVLAPDAACGAGALKVVDIPGGATRRGCRRPGPACRSSSTAPAGARPSAGAPSPSASRSRTSAPSAPCGSTA